MPASIYLMSLTKRRILAQLAKWPVNPAKAAVIAGAIGMGIAVAAFGTAPDSITEHVPQQEVARDISTIPQALDIAPSEFQFTREDRIRLGDTVDSLLARVGITEAGLVDRLRQIPGAASLFRQMSPGKLVSAITDSHGRLIKLTFPLNNDDRVVEVSRDNLTLKVEEKKSSPEVQVVMKSTEIRYSLFGATDSAGIPDAVATQLADIFGGDIDFHRDLRKGDRFSVIYETVNSQGKTIRTGRILASEFVNNGKRYQAVWFGTPDVKGGYYTPDGRSLHKAFLRSPLEFSRVTSGFSTARFHPVLQTWRAHKGVDYGAAIGTRVRATADGVVEFVGTQGGYGKVVILRHQGRYSTVYGHLSAFTKGLRVGSKVAQGDTIALTGASGLASGPHLHFEFRVDGVHQNPLTVALPGSPPLPPQQIAAFRRQTSAELERVNLIRSSNTAILD